MELTTTMQGLYLLASQNDKRIVFQANSTKRMAPRVGYDPTTPRLTAACSANWANEEYITDSSV